MNIKLDEKLPKRLAATLRQLGNDVDTVGDEHLLGAADDEVWAATQRERRLLITLDRAFGDIRRFPPGTHGGIVLLRLDDTSFRLILNRISELCSAQMRQDW